MNFLIIKNDKVTNVILAESKEIAEELTGGEAIEATGSEPWINWTRSGDTWTAPVIEEPTE
jgi:hypothetical protein